MNRMNLLDLDNDSLNIIGDMVKRDNETRIKKENKRTEIINEAFEYFMNREEPTDPYDDMRQEIWDVLLYHYNFDEMYEDIDKVLEKLREAGYNLTEYDERKW